MFFKRKNNEKNNKLDFYKIAHSTQIPISSPVDCSHLEINSNREIIVEGCQGILQYDENLIRLNTGKMIVAFYGQNLSVKCLNIDSLIVVGIITSVEFIT